MSKSIYLINPKPDYAGYWSGDFGYLSIKGKSLFIADLAINTVAALVPSDFRVELCEEQINNIDYNHPAEFIGISGRHTQYRRMISIAKRFRDLGKTVIIGGACASLNPEDIRPYCDILFEGELEATADEFFSDLRNDTWKDHYQGVRPDLALSPIPKWDLYPNDQVVVGTVQTSRGCPYSCEFCDVIHYLGRKQRHKKPDQVLMELDLLYRNGYREVFLSDDNFTADYQRTKQLLEVLKRWNNNQTAGRVNFITQVSIDVSSHEDILALCCEAGLTSVFVGIETPNEDSLKETGKLQNLKSSGGTLIEKTEKIVTHGIMVEAGMVVGFDNDDRDTFRNQFDFAMSTPIPIFALNALVAPTVTPLYHRLQKAGRLINHVKLSEMKYPWNTNIVPYHMSMDEFNIGLQWLGNNLYTMANFRKRLMRLIDLYGTAIKDMSRLYDIHKDNSLSNPDLINTVASALHFTSLGKEAKTLWREIRKALKQKPWLTAPVLKVIIQYMHIRQLYIQTNFWAPHLANNPLILSDT